MVIPEVASLLEPIEVKSPQGCDDFLDIVEKYNWDTRIALAIMEAESHCKTDAVGDTWVIGGVYAPSCGLMQVRTISEWRGTCDELKEPEFNINKAYTIYTQQGWHAWSMYNNGKYKQYL